MNLASNHLNSGDGWEDFVCSIKSKLLRCQNICIIYFPMIVELITLETEILLKTYFCRADAFKYSFFPYSISEWNKLDPDLCNAKSYSKFRKSLLKSGRPSPNHIYKIHDPLGLKLLTRLRLGLSHLNEPRFNHNFHSCRH